MTAPQQPIAVFFSTVSRVFAVHLVSPSRFAKMYTTTPSSAVRQIYFSITARQCSRIKAKRACSSVSYVRQVHPIRESHRRQNLDEIVTGVKGVLPFGSNVCDAQTGAGDGCIQL